MTDQTIVLKPITDLPNTASDAQFYYTGADATFTVPANVAGGTVTVTVVGAAGGTGALMPSLRGGRGGAVTGEVPVTPGTTVLTVKVGGTGSVYGYKPGGAGGLGSRRGGNGGVGGTASALYNGTTLLLVGGGGGGPGGDGGDNNSGGRGADGGYSPGIAQPGTNAYQGSNAGGPGASAAAANGAGGSAGGFSGSAGAAGSSTGGGAGGAAYPYGDQGGGGGGGGGYFSGGGGGGAGGNSGGGGGGGGTSYADASVTSVSYDDGFNTGNGYVIISWTVTLPSPAVHSDNFYMGNGSQAGQYSTDTGRRDFAATFAGNPSTPGDYAFAPRGVATRTLGVQYPAYSLPTGTQIRGVYLRSLMNSVGTGAGSTDPQPIAELAVLLETGSTPVSNIDLGTVSDSVVTSQIPDVTVGNGPVYGSSSGQVTLYSTPLTPRQLVSADIPNLLGLLTIRGNVPETRVYSMDLVVDYNEPPNATVSLPGLSGGNVTTLAPLVIWTYSDPETDVQASFRVVVFTAAQVAASGFNPNANGGNGNASGWGTGTTPVYDSGDIVSATNSWWIPWVLANSTAYRVFVLVSDLGSNGRYNVLTNSGTGGMNQGLDFTTNAPAYNAPTIGTLVFDPVGGSISIPITVGSNPSFVSPYFMLQSSPDQVNWTTTRLLNPNQHGNTSFTYVDYEYPGADFGSPQTVYYRAWSAGTLNGGPVQSPTATASITGANSFSPTQWLLIDPQIPADNVALQVKKATFTTDENQQVLMPVSRGRKVVIGDTAIFGDTVSLDLLTITSTQWDGISKQMAKVYPLVLRSPDGEMWHVRATKRSRERVWQGSYFRPYRTYSISFETVDSPPVTQVTL
jgi:hypothetical protein